MREALVAKRPGPLSHWYYRQELNLKDHGSQPGRLPLAIGSVKNLNWCVSKDVNWCQCEELNPGPSAYETAALTY